MVRELLYSKMPKWIRIATRRKKEVSMDSQGLVECPGCGYRWNLAANEQFGLVLFERTRGICPKCDVKTTVLSQTIKIKREHSEGIHTTKLDKNP
jgi:uncharacterized Zn finger protein (UPF0148 family)